MDTLPRALWKSCLFLAACQTAQEPAAVGPTWREIEGEPLIELLPRDRIPAIDEPTFVSAAEADAFLQPDETVLGVVGVEGTARCYSAWQLDRHEIVNDRLDGEPIAATW